MLNNSQSNLYSYDTTSTSTQRGNTFDGVQTDTAHNSLHTTTPTQLRTSVAVDRCHSPKRTLCHWVDVSHPVDSAQHHTVAARPASCVSGTRLAPVACDSPYKSELNPNKTKWQCYSTTCICRSSATVTHNTDTQGGEQWSGVVSRRRVRSRWLCGVCVCVCVWLACSRTCTR